jgi:hypothetical protein
MTQLATIKLVTAELLSLALGAVAACCSQTLVAVEDCPLIHIERATHATRFG